MDDPRETAWGMAVHQVAQNSAVCPRLWRKDGTMGMMLAALSSQAIVAGALLWIVDGLL